MTGESPEVALTALGLPADLHDLARRIGRARAAEWEQTVAVVLSRNCLQAGQVRRADPPREMTFADGQTLHSEVTLHDAELFADGLLGGEDPGALVLRCAEQLAHAAACRPDALWTLPAQLTVAGLPSRRRSLPGAHQSALRLEAQLLAELCRRACDRLGPGTYLHVGAERRSAFRWRTEGRSWKSVDRHLLDEPATATADEQVMVDLEVLCDRQLQLTRVLVWNAFDFLLVGPGGVHVDLSSLAAG